jgi:site-specific recombinase XerD
MPMKRTRLPSNPDLFDESEVDTAAGMLDTWLESWLAESRLSKQSSEAVYRDMWGAFKTWCLSQSPPVRPDELTRRDLELFIASRTGRLDADGELAPRYVWRLLNLIDRVITHAQPHTRGHAGTAAAELIASRPEVRYVNAGSSALPSYLPAHEARALVVHLSHIRPRSAARAGVSTWQDLRNHASVALQLGAGLTPGDVRALAIDGVVIGGGRLKGVPWKLAVPADGNTPARETPIAQWAGQLLAMWLAVRTEMCIPGPWLFPSTRTGKPWSKARQYAASRQVLAAAGLESIEGGSFRLRHTFALRQLRRGMAAAEVARWMGIANVEEMERYRRVLSTPAQVV